MMNYYVRRGTQRRILLFAIATSLLLIIIILMHVIPAVLVKDAPPLACQLFGGHWSAWNGWECN